MTTLRRALVALFGAGVVLGALRLRGTEARRGPGGGWRELSGPDLR